MQLNGMDCIGRSTMNEHDSDIGDDMSHDDHSDDENRDCDSDERHHNVGVGPLIKISVGATDAGGANGSDHGTDMSMGHHRQFNTNHHLNTLGNFMGIGNLHGISNLPHNDILEKLQMQVRDLNVALPDQAHAAVFGSNVLPTPINAAFAMPPTTMTSFTHAAHTLAVQTSNNLNSHPNPSASLSTAGGLQNDSHNNFSFTSPTAPGSRDVNPPSNSSTSSETSSSSQHNNGWSFEEQYKQVRQLYEINDDPKRKEFLDELFSFMAKRGTPITRLPIMAKSVLDLFELYNLVIARGGLVDVINKKLWQEIIKGLHLPSSITSAAFTLRTQYMKYLYPYECEKKNLSTPAELQAAIDGNRREGRRSSYGQYEAMHNQMQMPQMSRQSLPGSIQQISPLALVTHAANNQQAQAAAAAVAAHHRLMAPSFAQVPNLMPQAIEQRMLQCLKFLQGNKEQNPISNGSGTSRCLSPHRHHHPQQRQQSQSPEMSSRDALNALEMSRVALWQMYNSNASQPVSLNTSPQNGENVNRRRSHDSVSESHRSEGLNLSDLPPNMNTVKREREPTPESKEHNDLLHQPPPSKRSAFPASFYMPAGVSSSATTYQSKDDHDTSDNEIDENDIDERNRTTNFSNADPNERQGINSSTFRTDKHRTSVHNDKSDDSAIENSPTTSAASAGNGHVSPVSTKTLHLSKQSQPPNYTSIVNNNGTACGDNNVTNKTTSVNQFQALNLLAGMQFRVTQHGSSSTGEQQLAVNLELNGIKYSGVLVSNTQNLQNLTTKSTEATTMGAIVPSRDDSSFINKNATISHTGKNGINNFTNINKCGNETISVPTDAIQGSTEMLMRATLPETSHATANNQNSIANALNDPLTTS